LDVLPFYSACLKLGVVHNKKDTLPMEEQIKFGKKVFIRNAGKDEYWLQDIIYENPSKLGWKIRYFIKRPRG
jgi:hypothetical protein